MDSEETTKEPEATTKEPVETIEEPAETAEKKPAYKVTLTVKKTKPKEDPGSQFKQQRDS